MFCARTMPENTRFNKLLQMTEALQPTSFVLASAPPAYIECITQFVRKYTFPETYKGQALKRSPIDFTKFILA